MNQHRFQSLVALSAIAAVAIILASPADARACTCAAEDVKQAFERAGAVFEGTVTSIVSEGSQPDDSTQVELTVARSWKGVEADRVTVTTAGNEAVCGYRFAQDETYLVYASKNEDGELRVSLCSRTQPLSRAAKDLEALGVSKPPSSTGCKRCATALNSPIDPGTLVATMGLCLVLWRRRRIA